MADCSRHQKPVPSLFFLSNTFPSSFLSPGSPWKLPGKDLPPEKGVRIEDGKYVALTEEELDVAVGLKNAGGLIAAITGAVNTRGKTELEGQSKEKNGKNPEGTD